MDATSAGYTDRIRRGREWLAVSAVVPRIAAGLVITGLLAVVTGLLGILIVAGDRFIPWWMLGGILLAGALILLRSQAAARRSVPEEEAFRWSALQSRWLRVSASAAAIFCVLGMGFDALNNTGYTVVSENSAGCKLVARESTFIRAGSGTMFLAEPSGVAFRAGSWRVDEGDRPARDGDVKVRWTGTTVTYLVQGALYDPDAESSRSARCWTEAVLDRVSGD